MKKLFAVIATAFIAVFLFTVPANATVGEGHDNPSADNKKIEFCHATSSDSNPYVKIETSVMTFYKAGHIDHEGDIWPAFSYTTVKGDVVNVPAQGDTSLLAFDDCKKPKVDEKVAKPDVVFADECGTENDIFSVAPGRGYTVGAVAISGDSQTISATLDEGFSWNDGSKDVFVASRPVFTNIDCGLPNTGGSAAYAKGIGVAALVGMIGLGAFSLRRRASN